MKFWKAVISAIALLLAVSPAALADKEDKAVNMALFWLDADIDPALGWHGWTLTRCGIGENLLQVDENLKFKPVIAESWEQVDGLTTVFKIREGITFQNGKKVDAAACKASIQRVLDVTDRKDMKLPIASMTADGNTLTVKTSKPEATLLNSLADPVYIILDAEAAADPEQAKVKPVSTGPFMVRSFSPETGLVLDRYSGYWKGESEVEAINVKYISDATTRNMALQSGELDIATQISPNDLKILEKNKNLNVIVGPNLRIFFIRTNFAHPWMQIPEFRQAVRHGIQKDVYATKIANAIPARGPFNELLPFSHEGNDPYTYDPDRAKELLDTVGIVDTNGDGVRELNGTNITLHYVCMTNHGASARNIGLAMQNDLKKIGIALEVQQLENFAEAAKQGKFDFLFERWTSAPALDPRYFLASSFKSGAAGNYGMYSNKEYDALLDKLDAAMETEERSTLGREAVNILLDDAASIFLFYEKGNIVHNKRVEGVYHFTSEIYYIDDRLKFADKK